MYISIQKDLIKMNKNYRKNHLIQGDKIEIIVGCIFLIIAIIINFIVTN